MDRVQPRSGPYNKQYTVCYIYRCAWANPIHTHTYIYSIQYIAHIWGPHLRQTDEHQRVEAVVIK